MNDLEDQIDRLLVKQVDKLASAQKALLAEKVVYEFIDDHVLVLNGHFFIPLRIKAEFNACGENIDGAILLGRNEGHEQENDEQRCLTFVDGRQLEQAWYFRGEFNVVSIACSLMNEPIIERYRKATQTQRDRWMQVVTQFRGFVMDDFTQRRDRKWKKCITRMEEEIVNLRMINSVLMNSLIAMHHKSNAHQGFQDDVYQPEDLKTIFDPLNVPIWPNVETDDDSRTTLFISSDEGELLEDDDVLDDTQSFSDRDTDSSASKDLKQQKRKKKSKVTIKQEAETFEEEEARGEEAGAGSLLGMESNVFVPTPFKSLTGENKVTATHRLYNFNVYRDEERNALVKSSLYKCKNVIECLQVLARISFNGWRIEGRLYPVLLSWPNVSENEILRRKKACNSQDYVPIEAMVMLWRAAEFIFPFFGDIIPSLLRATQSLPAPKIIDDVDCRARKLLAFTIDRNVLKEYKLNGDWMMMRYGKGISELYSNTNPIKFFQIESINVSKKKRNDEQDSDGRIDSDDSFVVPDEEEGNDVNEHRRFDQKRNKKRAKKEAESALKKVDYLKRTKFNDTVD